MQELILSVWIMQGILMLVDEFYFHKKRGLGAWESRGHPVDTLFFLMPFLYTQFFHSNIGFMVLAVMSSLIITKDEFVHSRECKGGEHWLHSVLFVLHPIALLGLWKLWEMGHNQIIIFQSLLISLFMLYQIFYWNFYVDSSLKQETNR